jgi:hypothetical protein
MLPLRRVAADGGREGQTLAEYCRQAGLSPHTVTLDYRTGRIRYDRGNPKN